MEPYHTPVSDHTGARAPQLDPAVDGRKLILICQSGRCYAAIVSSTKGVLDHEAEGC